MTRIELAKKGIVTDEVKFVAAAEGITPEQLSEDIAAGTSVIPININHKISPIGIGRNMRTKVNANIGTSKDKSRSKRDGEARRSCEVRR
jgi:phosphomethylpyrimidine synthase